MAEQERPSEITIGDSRSIYPIFDKLIETTVLEHKSLITDYADKEIFNSDNLNQIKKAYIGNLDEGKGSFADKIEKQIAGIEEDKVNDCKHIITNLLYLRDMSNDGISKETKSKRINPFSLKLKDNPFGLQSNNEEDGKKLLFPTDGIASYRTDTSTHIDFVELIRLYEYLLKEDTLKGINNVKDIRIKINEWVLREHSVKSVSCSPIDHMLLHLCDPDKYSTTSSLNKKQQIVENLYKRYLNKDYDKNNMSLDKVDELLKELSNCDKLKNIANRNNLKHWSSVFWYSEIRSQWQGGYVANAYEILTKYQKQVILYGAPGTGKTYSAEQIIKEFICEVEDIKELEDDKLSDYKYKDNYDWTNEDSSKNVEDKLNYKKVIWEMVQFNQSYSYEDFIEGMLPIEGGKLKLVDGIFKRFCNEAMKYSSEDKQFNKPFIFVIDEINRGKIDKIFGELLYLLEYRNKKLRLHYSNKEFSIPENVYIIGTMNTADKSIALLDVALRRRFWFVRCEPNCDVLFEKFGIDKNDEKIINEDKPGNIKKLAIKLFDWLNKKLDSLGSDADELKIGHSYFLKLAKDDVTFSDLKNIWLYSIVPLIEEYCGFDKARVEELLKGLSKKDDFELGKLASWKWN